MKKNRLFLIAPAIVILAVIFFFFPRGEKNRIDHIFLITIDTFRADHLGSYGYVRDTTPFIDSLAKKGALFEKAISQSATTCPSFASVFTGVYPGEHKVLANGYVLDDSFETLAEILKVRGYTTAAFTSTDRHFLASNMDQGFDKYEEPEDTSKSFDLSYRPGEFTVKIAKEWLKRFNKDEKLFIWIHLFDPHQPYQVSKKEMREHFPEEERKEFKKYLKDHIKRTGNSKFKKFDRAERLFTKYDTEIRSVDDQVRSLFDFAQKRGLNERSLWVISSDHGEGLGQHDWIEHAMELYQESIHVPLIFYSPEKKWGFRYTGVVENFNIFSTIVEMTGSSEEKYGDYKISSKSLKKVLDSSGKIVLEQLAFSERQFLGSYKSADYIIPKLRRFYSEGEKYSIQNNRYKYILRTAGIDELFDLEKDPYELINLLNTGKKTPEGNRLKKRLMKIVFRIKRDAGISEKLTNKTIIEKLKSLGYVF